MPEAISQKGLYFEELSLGEMVTTGERTVTEADILNFSDLSGDHNRMHTDPDFASRGPFGRPVAHGLLGASIASGLLVQQLGFLEKTLIAFRELTWKFSLPIFIGDTIQARAAISELKPYARLNSGLVGLTIDLINQDGKIVQTGHWKVLVKLKPNE